MTGDAPKPRNPISPYYPSEVPDIPGNGRTWFTVLLGLMLVLGATYWAFSMLF